MLRKNPVLKWDITMFKNVIEEQMAYYRLIKHSDYFGMLPDDNVLPEEITTELQELIDFCNKIESALNCLAEREKELVKMRYMDIECEYLTDQEISERRMNPSMSRMTFWKIRARAIVKLAPLLVPERISLKIEYKQLTEGL